MRSLLLLILAGSWEVAATLRSGRYCFEGCLYTLGCVTFNDTSPALPHKIRTCMSTLRATSLYLCIENYCDDEGRSEWLTGQNGTCQKTTGLSLPPYEVVAEYVGTVDGVRRLSAEEGFCDGNAITLGEVVIPGERYHDRAYRTLEAAYGVEDIHWLYAMCMYYFWGIVISIGVSTRLVFLIRGIQHQEWTPIPDSECNETQYGTKDLSLRSRPYSLLKRHIIMPATFGYRCSQNIRWCTIPPRIQSLTITSFVILNILLCTCSYPVMEGNIFWPEVSAQYWRYVSDRTGIISMANLPLIWLFGTRNNTLIWLTGWGFGTYNNFHRWVARVATVQAVVHSIGYTEMVWESGGWNTYLKYWTKFYFWNGELATIFMCAICVFSVYGLRRSHYEIFLVTHIVLSVLVLVTMYYHVEIFNGEWNVFLWPSLFIWLFDRALRTLRILAFNSRFWNTKCEVTYNSHSNLVRLEIPCSQSFLAPKPGSYYYVYALDNLLYAHQSHPFTLAYVASNVDANEREMRTRTSSPSHQSSASRSPSQESSESEALLPHQPTSSQGPSSSLVFLVRPYDGFTSRLAQTSAHKPSSLRVLIEGPYGDTAPLHTFPNILFLVGGTGIAVPMSYMSKLLTDPQSRVRKLRIVWAVREHSFFVDVLQRFEKLLSDERVEVDVHVTKDEENKDDPVAKGLEGVGLFAGRPDVDREVGEMAKGRCAVVACGPSMMADEARRACVEAVAEGHKEVEYFEESFKW